MMRAMKATKNGFVVTLLLIVVVLGVFSGCRSEDQITSEQAEEAFMVAFGGAYVGSIAAQVGQPLPGISFDQENNAIVFEDFDVSELQTDYQAISGTVTSTEESATASFTLTGGPVETISFSMGPDQMSNEDGISATVTVNGREMDIEVDPNAAVQ